MTTDQAATADSQPKTGSSLDHLAGQYLTFTLADEQYGLDILTVREIIGVMDITQVPQMPEFVKGVVNLRGRVIPVIDLRLKFAMESVEYTEATCIIVVDVGQMMGIIVDTVQEVIDVHPGCILPPPPLGGGVDTTFILGMGKVSDEIRILLDIQKVLTDDEIQDVVDAAQNVAS